MPTLLFEQPWIVGTLGAIVTAATLFGWLQTGNVVALRSACGLLVGTVLLVLLNGWVVTEEEVIRDWLDETVGLLERNEFDEVFERIHPEASERVAARKGMLKYIQFSSVRITKIHGVEVTGSKNLRRAEIRMNVFAEGDFRQATGKIPRWIKLSLVKTGENWLVADIDEKDPLHEFMDRE